MIERGKIQKMVFFSEELQEDITLLIYLPNHFSSLYKYHLLIVSDGRDYFQMGRLGKIADELLANQEMENTIIVGVCYKDIQDRTEKYHPNGSQHKSYQRFLAYELVPYLDREFPTYQMGSTRALMGDSLAGTVSFITALHYPHTFGKAIMHSPFVNDEILTAASNMSQSEFLSIYHIIGTEETAVKTTQNDILDFVTPNRELSHILSKQKCLYIYHEFQGNHTWTYWQSDLRRTLKSMFC